MEGGYRAAEVVRRDSAPLLAVMVADYPGGQPTLEGQSGGHRLLQEVHSGAAG